jgi:hypothetical protein
MRLLRDVEKFLRRTGMRPTRFGRIVAADPRLVFDMRQGREPRLILARKIEAYLKEAGQ